MTSPPFRPDWRAWVSGIPADRFPLTPERLLQWLRQEQRIPMLFWDQFRTRLLTACAGEEWESEAELLAALGRVDWGF